MATLFTRIINGELPGRFVHRDPLCVAFLSIHPLQPGHTLVVPVEEVDHWIDLKPELLHHCMQVAQRIARAAQQAFEPEKVGLMLAGLEVPHVHFHVVPINSGNDMDFSNQNLHATAAELDAAAEKLRQALK
ncbi:HIT family protein [bacterium]|nr:HIT family protein [bacterium]